MKIGIINNKGEEVYTQIIHDDEMILKQLEIIEHLIKFKKIKLDYGT